MGRLRRTTELGLLVLAVIITTGAYTLASLGRDAEIPANIGPFLALLLGLFVGAHIAIRKLAPNADGVLFPLAVLLNGIGYVFIVRIDEAKARPDGLAGYQLTWTALGIVGFVATLFVIRRARDLERYRYTFLLIGIGLLVIPLVPFIGREINGAQIWVSIGPVNFQPGEFAKIALALFFAGYLVERRELLAMSTWRLGPLHLPDPKVLGPVLVAWAFSLVVMTLEKDLGSSLLFFALFVALLWIATERVGYLVIGGVLFAAGALFAWSTFAHVQDRVEIWLNPWPVAKDEGFQVVEAGFAVADGQLTGTGLALGNPLRIPEVETDFIFAAIAEELGLFGGTAILVAFMLMIGAGLRIAVRAENPFEKLLAAGLTTLIGVQSFIIIAGVIRVLPLTGVTLPFVSYGGSSLVANYILLALLLRISDSRSSRVAEGEFESVAT
ncbi:MAG TPA: FtsW/RodA/SpoVE family cell cycle protein [Acidimicrobiales bacterium]|nr:FtsW/RodA/SpoVE family cell cycle protein [Acidimicrobiales bacterium]